MTRQLKRSYVVPLSRRGQITVSSAIRDVLDLQPFDKVRISLEGDRVIARKVVDSLDALDALRGMFSMPPRPDDPDFKKRIEEAREEYVLRKYGPGGRLEGGR